MDLEPLLKELQRHELIMHGADYDLRLLRKGLNFVPSTIFDTMIASRLLGIREFGLNHLVWRFLNVRLEKGPQKANWARRPLTERMAEYALNDARYLKPVADTLRDQLMQKGRLEWHREMCDTLIKDCARLRPPDPEAVWRVKGSHHLHPPALAVLRELWHWREQEAIKSNRPPFFVLPPDTMVIIAQHAVSDSGTRRPAPAEAPHAAPPRGNSESRREGPRG